MKIMYLGQQRPALRTGVEYEVYCIAFVGTENGIEYAVIDDEGEIDIVTEDDTAGIDESVSNYEH